MVMAGSDMRKVDLPDRHNVSSGMTGGKWKGLMWVIVYIPLIPLKNGISGNDI